MDTLAHGLWGGVGFSGAGGKRFAAAIVLGMAPDLLSFGLFHLSHPGWIIEGLAGRISGPPPLASLPPWLLYSYNLTHSLIVWSALFALLWRLRKRPPLPFLAWGLHILCDIPTHGLSYFPTPYLWPLPTPYVQGIPWSRPWFMIANYTTLLVAYAAVVGHNRRRAARVRIEN